MELREHEIQRRKDVRKRRNDIRKSNQNMSSNAKKYSTSSKGTIGRGASTVFGSLKEKTRSDELERKARIAKNAQKRLNESKLPPRMEMWERTVGREKKRLIEEREKRGMVLI